MGVFRERFPSPTPGPVMRCSQREFNLRSSPVILDHNFPPLLLHKRSRINEKHVSTTGQRDNVCRSHSIAEFLTFTRLIGHRLETSACSRPKARITGHQSSKRRSRALSKTQECMSCSDPSVIKQDTPWFYLYISSWQSESRSRRWTGKYRTVRHHR